MRLRLTAIAFGIALVGAPAFAEDVPAAAPVTGDYAALQQIELTEDQVSRYIGSLDDMQKAMGDVAADAAEPDAKTMAKLEAIARKHGFRNFDEYNTVAGNISLVVDGIDPETKQYVGEDKLIAKAIDGVKADTKLAAADKETAAHDLEGQLKAVVPIKYKSNIDLVVKHYGEINGG